MVGMISAVRTHHDRENYFWDADAHCHGCRVSLCVCNTTLPWQLFTGAKGCISQSSWPRLTLQLSSEAAEKRKKKHWGTCLVILPERCPFHAALGKASFHCRVGQGPPFTHLGVLGPHGHLLLQSVNAQRACPRIDLLTRGFLVNARVNKHLDYKRDTDMANIVMAKAGRLLQTSFMLVPCVNTYVC